MKKSKADKPEKQKPYTQKELDDLLDQGRDLEIDDTRLDIMAFLKGRYYAFAYSMPLPEQVNPPHGGDVCGLVWCRDDDKTKWFTVWRFRYYASKHKVWDNKDRKSWWRATIPNTDQADIERKTLIAWRTIGLIYGTKLDVFQLHCDADKAFDLFTNPLTAPPWMHMKTIKGELPPEVKSGEKSLAEYAAELDAREQN